MQVRIDQFQEGGVPCGCGRSPTGRCCGWHGLSDEEFKQKKAEWEMEQYRKKVEDTWFHENGGLK